MVRLSSKSKERLAKVSRFLVELFSASALLAVLVGIVVFFGAGCLLGLLELLVSWPWTGWVLAIFVLVMYGIWCWKVNRQDSSHPPEH